MPYECFIRLVTLRNVLVQSTGNESHPLDMTAWSHSKLSISYLLRCCSYVHSVWVWWCGLLTIRMVVWSAIIGNEPHPLTLFSCCWGILHAECAVLLVWMWWIWFLTTLSCVGLVCLNWLHSRMLFVLLLNIVSLHYQIQSLGFLISKDLEFLPYFPITISNSFYISMNLFSFSVNMMAWIPNRDACHQHR